MGGEKIVVCPGTFVVHIPIYSVHAFLSLYINFAYIILSCSQDMCV